MRGCENTSRLLITLGESYFFRLKLSRVSRSDFLEAKALDFPLNATGMCFLLSNLSFSSQDILSNPALSITMSFHHTELRCQSVGISLHNLCILRSQWLFLLSIHLKLKSSLQFASPSGKHFHGKNDWSIFTAQRRKSRFFFSCYQQNVSELLECTDFLFVFFLLFDVSKVERKGR